MNELPDEVLQQIFSTLTARDLLHATWTCTSWRQTLLGKQTWWHAWCSHRWPSSTDLIASGSSQASAGKADVTDNWQQHALTKGLHIPWRFKPVKPKRLLYCVGRQDGWDRRGHPPAVLVEGDWALLTCTPGRAGPSGGRDRLQLIKLKSPTKGRVQQVPVSQHDKYWLDFGTNKYKPYALQGGATDLHMPFVAQGRASDVVVWKADQQYPMAVLHQKAAATVPAVAIERTPWGQHAEADSLRLVSCSDTGQVYIWFVDTVRGPTPLWQGQAAGLCGMQQHAACNVTALAMWSLSRPTGEGRTACCIAVGTDRLGIALLSLSFNQPGPTGIASQAVQLIPHTASVLRMCVSWDVMPAVCAFATPPREEQLAATVVNAAAAAADAAAFVGMPLVVANASLFFANNPWYADGAVPRMPSLSALELAGHGGNTYLATAPDDSEGPECSAAASHQTLPDQQSRATLAAACDRTHLSVIWGPTPEGIPDQPCDTEASSSHASSNLEAKEHSATGAARPADVVLSREASWQPQGGPAADTLTDRLLPNSSSSSSSSQMTRHSNGDQRMCTAQGGDHSSRVAPQDDGGAPASVGYGGAVSGPDDLVACLRRLRPHLHASGPFSPRSASAKAEFTSLVLPDRSVCGVPADHDSLTDAQLDSSSMQQGSASVVQQRADQSRQQQEARPVSVGGETVQQQAQASLTPRRERDSTAYPPWLCVKGPCTATQLKALKLCCSSVACFDVLPQLASSPPHDQDDTTATEASAQQGHDQGCGVRPLWSHPVVAASHLSAADGAVAVACSDGMLLLLDQATGQLIRRVPNSQLDQRFMERQKSLANVHTAWLDPSPVLNCTVWWGHLGSSSGHSHYILTVVTELPLAGAPTGNPKELCIEQYACARDDVPVCKCKDGNERTLALLRTTVAPRMASMTDFEQQESILNDIQDGVGHPLSNMYSLGIQLPHQHVARRYFTCGRRTHWPYAPNSGCMFAEFLD